MNTWITLSNPEWVHDRAEILGWICAIGIAIALLLMWWTGRIIRHRTDAQTTQLATQLATTQTALGETQTELQQTRSELEEARRPRSLTTEQQVRLVAMLRSAQPARVDIMTLNGDPESFRFGSQIGEALQAAGWQARVDLPTLGIPPGLLVLVHHGPIPENARILSDALEQVGFHAPITDNPTPLRGDLGIIVGAKPQ